MSTKSEEINIETRGRKRKAIDVESDSSSKSEKKKIKKSEPDKEEEVKENRIVVYNKNLVADDEDEESIESVEKIERFASGYSTNTLSNYNTFVCHLGNWGAPLKNYLSHPQFRSIFDFVKHEYDIGTCFPPKNLIFNAFQLTPFDKLKVVMIGLDPFVNKNEAMGLSFSVSKDSVCPPATLSMYKALENDTKLDFKPPIPIHGDLQDWAKQGVLMLNNCLTVREGASYSHSKAGWNKFTKAVLDSINKEKEGVIFLCWGNQAAKIWKSVDKKKHYVLTYGSPSPLSQKFQKFEDCKNFSKVNEILDEEGLSKIEWNLK